jgi:hypothetical protein
MPDNLRRTNRTATVERPQPSPAKVDRARRRLRRLAQMLTDCGQPALAIATDNVADLLTADSETTQPNRCPLCRHRHPIGTECCTLCGWRTVRS